MDFISIIDRYLFRYFRTAVFTVIISLMSVILAIIIYFFYGIFLFNIYNILFPGPEPSGSLIFILMQSLLIYLLLCFFTGVMVARANRKILDSPVIAASFGAIAGIIMSIIPCYIFISFHATILEYAGAILLLAVISGIGSYYHLYLKRKLAESRPANRFTGFAIIATIVIVISFGPIIIIYLITHM